MTPDLPPEPETVASVDLRRERENPPWSGWDVLAIALVAFAGIFILGLAGMGVARSFPLFRGESLKDMSEDARLVIPIQMLSYVCVLGFMYWVVARRQTGSFSEQVHWRWPRGVWPAYMVGGIALAFATTLVSNYLPVPKTLPIEKFFRTPADAYLMVLFGITAAPLLEELFFRGFLYPVLARRVGLAAAVILTAFAFALLHESQLAHAWAAVLVLFGVGVILTGIRAGKGSVAAGFVVHVSYNATLFTIMYIGTDHFRHLERLSQ